ncbi:MAG: MarC family protein [Chloroherpetonaceae bacterium]|nr:MarC family protein [Chloroherpetonaceae bacterium]MDW8466026.1 MarC family protein [Chloroherpetonaceae bacterium]
MLEFFLLEGTSYPFTFEAFLLTFIPLFVAIDAPGTLPLFIGLTQSLPEKVKRRLTVQAVLTALVISLIVMVAGKNIFAFLGITISDFRIAGGIILLFLAVQDLTTSDVDESKKPADPTSIGIVPIGIPLIIGPASLTTILISGEAHGWLMTALALALNLFIAFLLFYFSGNVEKLIGPNGAKAIAKIASLLLAAIAVMMIRVGVLDVISSQLKL